MADVELEYEGECYLVSDEICQWYAHASYVKLPSGVYLMVGTCLLPMPMITQAIVVQPDIGPETRVIEARAIF